MRVLARQDAEFRLCCCSVVQGKALYSSSLAPENINDFKDLGLLMCKLDRQNMHILSEGLGHTQVKSSAPAYESGGYGTQRRPPKTAQERRSAPGPPRAYPPAERPSGAGFFVRLPCFDGGSCFSGFHRMPP